MPWQIFEGAARTYESWYETESGERADRAERSILAWLLAPFPSRCSALEVGCGTGHFTHWLAARGIAVAGLDRSPAMLAEARRVAPGLPLILGDADTLPLRARSVDLVLLLTTLEFLEAPGAALAEAVRVARLGLIVIALNRWSLGALSRRCGRLRRSPLLSRARDYSVPSLRRALAGAAGDRLVRLRWSSTLLPLRPEARARIPLGDVIAMAAHLRV